jgi:hypothetical protein
MRARHVNLPRRRHRVLTYYDGAPRVSPVQPDVPPFSGTLPEAQAIEEADGYVPE